MLRPLQIVFVGLLSGLLSPIVHAQRVFTQSDREHWAFQELREPVVPSVRSSQIANPIDQFILDELKGRSLEPSPEADRRTLLRRAAFDLTGLPPSQELVSAFVETGSMSFEEVIDRMLASPRYAEKWARHWLDLAMYADSSGFEQDETRPNAWRYRDYVVDAFNRDKGYDRFLCEQIAGDEMWPDDIQAHIATGFMRHYPEEGNNKDILLARQEILHHVTDLIGGSVLGLTFNCAQCHDHKYDPILHKDYYRLQAFFANIGHNDKIPVATREEQTEYDARIAEYELRTEKIWSELDQILASVRKYSPKQLLARYPDYVIEAMSIPSSSRNPLQDQIAHILNNKDCGTCPQRPKPFLDAQFDKDARSLKGAAKERYDQLRAELDLLSHLKPRDLPRAMGISDISTTAPPTYVLGVGRYTDPKEEVEPGFLSVLHPGPAEIERPNVTSTTGRRQSLAKWIVDRRNPLTARVMVNRLWAHHFGRGIVGTPSDFGIVGDAPTHPELLDWLALRFMDSGWSIKQMQRLMMTSATYRQSSHARPGQLDDPDNRFLWRYQPQRLDAELIRDSILAVSGLLNNRLGGTSNFPPLPHGMPTPMGGWKESTDASDHVRRSLYIFVRRNDRFPMLDAFDFPDTHEACPCRNQSSTAPQALAMLNGSMSNLAARSLARLILEQAGTNPKHQVEFAFQRAFSRSPDPNESQMAIDFLSTQSQLVATDKTEDQREVALSDFCLVLLNSNEFIFRF